ncbi:MAG TPA: DUF4249 domain-containing protein [Puia sp.]|nr:DUF4249 domain-containing protein [Puia sp.]
MKKEGLTIPLFDVSVLAVMLVVYMFACKQPYTPPTGREDNSFLVINGFLNAGSDSTMITLSRSRSLADTTISHPELHAQVAVLGAFGEQYNFTEMANGRYSNPGLNMNVNETYRLQILSNDGKKYLSDNIAVTLTPAIDSISWKQDTTGTDNKRGVTVYANAHDPQNNTWYYQWEYEETWEYHAAFESFFLLVNGMVVPRNFDQFTYKCYRNTISTGLMLGSSAKLSQDVIFENPLVFIPQGSEKLGVRYSILVRQYGITKDAFEYWQNLKKNTELTGSIFDAQPSQVKGNIHCEGNPGEPVLGFITASTVQRQRIFISDREVEHWGYYIPGGCTIVIGNFSVPTFVAQGYVPVYQVTGGYASSLPSCVDCTAFGGTTLKPSFW